MTVCRGCGVQLDDGIEICPLCGTPAAGPLGDADTLRPAMRQPKVRKKQLLRQILWQITAVLLSSGIIATLAINLAIQGVVSWSVYPVSICLIVLAYTTLLALWRTTLVFQMLAGWLISAALLAAIDAYIAPGWPLKLALPLLSAVNIIGLTIILTARLSAVKGLNILAVTFAGFAALGVMTEGIISFYLDDTIIIQWSIIVAACLLPVTVAILFIYFRTKNNRDLQKIFHT
jgi:hypothetical protein